MIEFRGELSGDCKKYVLHREAKIGLISGLITATIFSIPIIILTIKIHWMFVFFLPVLLLFALLAGMPPSEKSYTSIFPFEIIVDTERKTITSKSEKFCFEYTFSEIVKVVDMGEWYHIYLNNKNGRFVCQKNLICTGTLEEFEELFIDKIIKSK